MSANFSVVGTRVPDTEAVNRVTGGTEYSIDVSRPGMLIGRLLRSPYPHARIVRIDTSGAERLPGVKDVVTFEDVSPRPFGFPYNQYLLDDVVRFVGEEVAAVAAETTEIADEALKRIRVEYQRLPHVVDPQAALAPDAPQIHLGGNLSLFFDRFTEERGDVAQGFAEADGVFENHYRVSAQPIASLRQFACVAEWDGSELTIWDSNQVLFTRRAEVAGFLNLPLNKVKVLSPYEGGGFGEDNKYRYVPLAALLAVRTGRPVKMVVPHDYTFEACPKKRHAARFDVKLGYRNDGTFTAMDVKALYDKGAYTIGGSFVPATGAEALFNGYRTPHMRYEVTAVHTNTPPVGAYRGYGAVQSNFAVQSAIDEVAAQLGLDPTEVHRKNAIRPDDQLFFPAIHDVLDFSTVGGSAFLEAIDRGKAAIGWDRWRPDGLEGEAEGVRKGLGVALLTFAFGAVPDTSSALVRINLDGTVDLLMGMADLGGGQRTVMSMIVAEELGARLDDVQIFMGSTEYPPAPVTGIYASRNTVIAGSGAQLAAADAKRRLLEAAATLLDVEPEELEARDSEVVVTETGERLSFAEVLAGLGTPIEGFATYVHTPYVASTGMQFGACFAEVSVNTWTGRVRVDRLALVQDYGHVLNPLAVEGQIVGAALQSLGYALTEDYVLDKETVQCISRGWLDYRVPSHVDTPEIDVVLLENPDPRFPFGAKGGGESMIVCTHSAIANAVANAIGVRFASLPITPQKVLEALRGTGGGG